MKVWVVTAGSYSDFHIVGVCSTEAAAKTYAEARDDHGYDGYDVDDVGMTPKGMKAFRVVMHRDGHVPPNPYRVPLRPYVELLDHDPEDEWETWDDTDQKFYAEMWAKDERHAVKIANERRTVFLSTPGGGDGT